ncbi:MAG: hypothetical protein AB1529_00790 [Candidatus Micrarchaeota archaeon]
MRPSFLKMLSDVLTFRREQWLSPAGLQELQGKKLARIIEAAKKTKFYSKRITLATSKPHSISSPSPILSEIPITTKDDIRSAPQDFLTKTASLHKASTSGSSGVPIDVYFDKNALSARAAGLAFAQTEFGRSPFDLFAEISDAEYSSLPHLASLGIFRKMHLSVFEDEEKNFALLQKAKPDILGWYPSIVGMMARLNEEAGNPVNLKSVFCGAEMLTKERRRLIGESFDCPVFNQYGSVEFGTIAFECKNHSLHVHPNCLAEIVDSQGRPTNGLGRLVITGLFNSAMPLLRYAVGDLAEWGKCGCGRGLPVLGRLEGREDDLITLPSGKKRSARSINLLDDIREVKSYQIVQEKEGIFVFRYVPAKGFDEKARKEIAKRIKRGCLGERITVEFEEANSIEKGRTGKISTVVSKVRK